MNVKLLITFGLWKCDSNKDAISVQLVPDEMSPPENFANLFAE